MLGLGAAAAAAEAPVAVTVGAVPSIPAAATYIAIEKGYFRDAGIEVRIENIDSASQAVAVLATNRMQVVEGAFPVGYFNALAKELPVVLALERGSSPLYHNFLVRTDLKDAIKSVADLKGRMVAIVAPGSIIVYETGKVLESAGLTLHDVTVKYIPFTQMAVAFANKAIDAAIMVPPFGDAVVEQGLAVRWLDPDDVIRPQPMAILVYMINTDWAAKNRDLARAYFVAVLRGAREYCQAYHDGPNRAEVVEIMMKHGAVSDRALLDKMPWPARDPDGRFSVDSLVDLQDWFYKEGLATAKFPASRLVDASYAEYAREKLGPFELVNKESRRVGCR
jgi:NitT/TauT family transport system substrate-binding protein